MSDSQWITTTRPASLANKIINTTHTKAALARALAIRLRKLIDPPFAPAPIVA